MLNGRRSGYGLAVAAHKSNLVGRKGGVLRLVGLKGGQYFAFLICFERYITHFVESHQIGVVGLNAASAGVILATHPHRMTNRNAHRFIKSIFVCIFV